MRPPRPVRCKLRMEGPDPTLLFDRPKPEPVEDDDPDYREPINILDLHHHPRELPLVMGPSPRRTYFVLDTYSLKRIDLLLRAPAYCALERPSLTRARIVRDAVRYGLFILERREAKKPHWKGSNPLFATAPPLCSLDVPCADLKARRPRP